MLLIFNKFSKVYSTIFSVHGHSDKYVRYKYLGWRGIESLSDKNIIKIGIGESNSVYLGADGAVYACGDNYDDQCGLGLDIDTINLPTEIGYFREACVKIVDIVTACYHSLALDTNGKVYSWEYNNEGQCGVGHSKTIKVLVLVEDLKEYKVDSIRCGMTIVIVELYVTIFYLVNE